MPDHPLITRLRAERVVPVVRTRSASLAATAIQWLRDAGLTMFEITMTIPDAPALIRELASDKGLLIGAGTVPDAAMAEACLAAGARFIVAPWVDPTLSAPCRSAGAALLLGALTPTEVRAALAAGADGVKIFPASSLGGPGHIKALASVFPGVAFCPTGGVTAATMGEWLAIPQVLCVGGTWLYAGGAVDRAAVAGAARDAVKAAGR